MILTSRLSTAPYLPDGSLPELKLLEQNWQEIREEALRLASSPNSEGDQTGWINRFTHFHWVFDQKRRAFKKTNLLMYRAAKFSLIGLALYLFIKL